MLIYWLLFLLVAWGAVTHMRPVFVVALNEAGFPMLWWGVFLLLTSLIGFRHQVGGDWYAYYDYVEMVKGVSFSSAFHDVNEPLYAILQWIGANVYGGIYFVNVVCGAIFSWALIRFCREQPRPWLALAVAVPYLVIVVAMGYTRQAVALAFAMVGIVSLLHGGVWRYMILMALGALFHKTVLVLLPAAFFVLSKQQLVRVGLGLGLIVALVAIYFHVAALYYLKHYFLDGMKSSGTTVRVAMNVVPALLFLVRRKRFLLSDFQSGFWTWMSIVALSFIPLLLVFPSSTALDRAALYLIPLQLFVLSRLPDAIGVAGRRNPEWVMVVLGYSACVLYVWLNFGTYAYTWLPYQFYPWVRYWSL